MIVSQRAALPASFVSYNAVLSSSLMMNVCCASDTCQRNRALGIEELFYIDC